MSIIIFPERLLKIEASGPSGALARNPVVGDIPASHDLLVSVATPRPNNLSKNAHRNMKDLLKTRDNWGNYNWGAYWTVLAAAC